MYTEFMVRTELGQRPTPADWLARFPQWKADLEQMFQVHAALCQAEASRPGGSRVPTLPALRVVLAPHTRIGGYEVQGELGRGAMGVVYRARQVGINRTVALKLINSGEYAGEKERERFRREGSAAGRLDHPNIVRVFEVGEHGGRPFCAMEYVDGGTLADRLVGKPWVPRDAARLVATLARAADHAHARGIVHRDLKPANILLTEVRDESGAGDSRRETAERPAPTVGAEPSTVACTLSPKIADFGLAKCVTDETGSGPTRTGDFLGTPAYMAPEQARGRAHEVGPAADVWALGVILYELLTGRPPFQGDSAAETMRDVQVEEPVPPRRLRPRVPQDVETVCLKCLSKEPAKRYASAAAFAADLERWLRGETILARRAGRTERLWRWCRRKPWIAALSAAVAGLFAAAVVLGAVAVVNLDAARTHADKLADREREGRVRAEVEGRREAARLAAEQRHVARLHATAGARLLDEGDDTAAALVFAEAAAREPDPDAAAVHARRLALTLRAGPRLEHVARVPNHPNRPALLSDDGFTLVTYTALGDPQFWDTLTGAARPALVGVPPNSDEVRIESLTTDGRVWAAVLGGKIRAWDTRTGREVALPLPPGGSRFADTFPPDGGLFLARLPGGKTMQLHAADGKAVGAPLVHPDVVVRHRFSPDGERLSTCAGPRVRVWSARTGKPDGAEISSKVGLWAAEFSPDGSRLVTGAQDGTGQVWNARTGDAVGPPLVMAGGHVVRLALFAPDGKAVLLGTPDGVVRVWDARTGSPLARSPTHGNFVTGVRFSPDGRTVVTGSHDRSVRVWDLATGALLAPPLVHGQATTAAFTPDGRLVTASRDGGVRVWANPIGSRMVTLPHPRSVTVGAWTPDGRTVLTGSPTPLLTGEVVVWDAADGTPRHRLAHPQPVISLAVSGGGGRVATVGGDRKARVWNLATGRPVGDPLEHLSVHRARFATDDRLITSGSNGEVVFWDVPTGRRVGQALAAGGAAAAWPRPDPNRLFVWGHRMQLWDVAGQGCALIAVG